MFFKQFTILVVLVLAVCFLWQYRQVDRLRVVVSAQEKRLAEVELQEEKRSAEVDVHKWFIAHNRRTILELKRSRKVIVTAYSPRREETDSTPFTTASNRRVRNGIVAVSRDLFNAGWVFGKKVYIKNYGIFVIDDLMAARKRNQIDIFMDDPRAALEFGRKRLSAHLIDS